MTARLPIRAMGRLRADFFQVCRCASRYPAHRKLFYDMNMARVPRPDGPQQWSSSMQPVSIEDRLAISDLFVRYTCALDAGEVDTLVDCFTEDGRLISPAVGEHAGHAAIRAFAERFSAFG